MAKAQPFNLDNVTFISRNIYLIIIWQIAFIFYHTIKAIFYKTSSINYQQYQNIAKILKGPFEGFNILYIKLERFIF